jgi:hypothetical protein
VSDPTTAATGEGARVIPASREQNTGGPR